MIDWWQNYKSQKDPAFSGSMPFKSIINAIIKATLIDPRPWEGGMIYKRKENPINDKRGISCLRCIFTTRIYRGQSVLIEGAYGVGKTRFLDLIKPTKLIAVRFESLDNKHEILASILQKLNYDAQTSYWRTSAHL